MRRWPHQEQLVKDTLDAISAGERRLLLTSPTGGGKTVVATDLIRHYIDRDRKAVLYTNRKLLVEQTSRVLDGAGLHHGVRAAGHEDNLGRLLQVSSTQTESARVIKRRLWDLHDAELVIVDEAHLQTGKTAQRILSEHREQGAACVGLTATPIGLADLYDRLIIGGTPSELRECGALVPCYHYGPDEPNLKHIGRVQLGEDLTENQNVKAIMTPTIWARVYEWWQRLNPDGKATILFAPGVGESVWFAEQFLANGVTVAHIDGEDVWINGTVYRSSREARDDVLAGAADGRIKVVCNRFVLREGIDMPFVEHMIFATVFGSLQSYLQSGGRGLRASASTGKTRLTLQDHGGNWHRHGSLNADREWRLEYTPGMVSGLREERIREKKEKEPLRCPQCGMILATSRCPCGYEVKPGKKSRPVIEQDGTLTEMTGDIFKERRPQTKPDTADLWRQMYWRARASSNGMTFRQAVGLFLHENWYEPPRTLPLMPTNELDWFRAVKDVPSERLST